MAEEPTTPTASHAENTSAITVDVKEANDATISESLTTPTPSKSQFNANAVEFVPGQFRSSAAPNPAAPVFTPQFQLTASGYVPINPYAMPYYMYVPTNGTGAPVATNADGTVVVSPVMTYQPRGPYAGGKGGLSRHNSTGARSARSDAPPRAKGGFRAPAKEETTPESNSPVIRPEEFPSMLGAKAATVGESSTEESKPTWAAIAKKPTPVVTIADELPKANAEPKANAGPTVNGELKTKTESKTKAEPKATAELKAKAEATAAVTTTEQPGSPKMELPKEPAASALPVSGKPKLAPWARPGQPQPALEETVDESATAETADEPEEKAVVEEQAVDELAVDESATGVSKPSVADPDVGSSGSAVARRFEIELLRRLRYHESCRPSAEVRASLPNGLLRARLGAEDTEDWRAASRGRARRGLSRSGSSRIEISAAMLLPSENSWSVAQQKKDSALDEDVRVERKIFAVLNKLTVEKFAKLSEQLLTECGIARPAHIVTLVKLLFDKATMQHHFIPMYADLCAKALAWLGSDAAPEELAKSIGPGERSTAAADIFRRVLLERCQERFYSYFISHDDAPVVEAVEAGPVAQADQAVEDNEGQDEAEARQKHRLSMLGTVRLVAQLLERRLMTRAVFRNCLETLLNPDERTDDHIDCACVFLGEVGRLFDLGGEDAYSGAVEDAMAELGEIAAEPHTAPRIKFAVMNLEDLRANGYAPKALPGQAAGPAKLAEVHRQVAKEELVRSASRGASELVRTASRAVSDEWETVRPATRK